MADKWVRCGQQTREKEIKEMSIVTKESLKEHLASRHSESKGSDHKAASPLSFPLWLQFS